MGSESEPEMDASEIAWRDLNLLQCAQADEPYDIPYGRMYVMMARIEQLHGATQDPGIAVDDLRPESASDADEIASWVQNLLHHIHGEYFHDSPETYKRLIRQWIFWTASNDVPFPNLQNLPHGGVSDLKNNGRHDMLPYTQRYITMAQVERLHGNTIQDPDIVIDALRPESASDADEIALWLRNVLQLIHGEYYPQHLGTYKRLIGQWIFWALLNDIALANTNDLPYSWRYVWLGTVARWVTAYLHKT
ncbi:hypothetical protein D9619_011373 [Psilocybe cf. subviscida]|uniref:Uncharacterized protein n=1 Tax=Psilocybe cf. subviscida TaxID=2480587 RepID=A0A8H5F5F2_9AGAR|nr:hypothetical protein D9619_011373 [Psilocybe cf. subviscida]